MRLFSVLGVIAAFGIAAGCAEAAPSPQLAHRGPQPNAPAGTPTVEREPTPIILPESMLRPTDAETAAAQKLVGLILELKKSVVTTRYQARTEVNKKKGLYAWDCSGMADWILRRSAPRARRALGKSRPRAIDFYKRIKRSPTKRARRGWQKLGHVSDARPGDVFAFPRSPLSKSKISGHVGFFVEQPWKFDDWPYEGEAWAARILDATGLPHQDDTRDYNGDGGFGFGTFLFVNDESGQTVAYGWFGTKSRGFLPTTVLYGRVSR